MPDAPSHISRMEERELLRMIRAQASSRLARRRWSCPSAEQVAAYVDQSLEVKGKQNFEAHISDCDFCIGLIGSLLRQQETAQSIDAPASLVRQAINAVPERASSGQSWRWVLAPALAGVVIASAVLLKPPPAAQLRLPHVSAPPRSETTPAASASVAEPEWRPAEQPQVRSLRTPSANLALLEPRAGSIVLAEGLRFRWKAVPQAVYYEIRVVNSEGDPVWRAESPDPAAVEEGTLSLLPGKYFVWVSAHLSDGRTLKSDTIGFQVRSSG